MKPRKLSAHATVKDDAAQWQQRSAYLADILDGLPSAMIVLDAAGMIVEANLAAIEMLGEPLEGERWRTIISRAFSPQDDDGYEISLKDGRLIKFVTRPLKCGSGQIIVLTDLTETRQLQARVAHLQRLSSLGKMVASLAHQVRTPLSAAMLYAANLGNESLNPVAREKFQKKLLDRLKDLECQVSDMLLFARSGEGLSTGQVSSQQLLTSIEQAVEVMVEQHKATLEVLLPEPDQILAGNASALSSAISNLVHNALQANASRIQVKAHPEGESLHLCVSDNGSGIAPHMIERIQEPFYTTRSQGTGLGLAVVKAVVQAHQGELKIRSQMNIGTQVCICLPLVEGLQAPLASEVVGE
ncbi:sensor histidine kinase [Echinimonas agarilytica]|uniref:histidine kinase n=1 Tax=Echinimonas agarilytica TaxID=1215918 RepID=A0AA41W4Z6_9GAMM|nr:ATP-binding protein [Echinimonas agarilytica]MCM2678961.1 ATP-binding protein [Echinimonas agarilytica]